jgi:hypothetical protein
MQEIAPDTGGDTDPDTDTDPEADGDRNNPKPPVEVDLG